MPSPYDYSSVLSPVDPGQAVMQGVLQGEQLLRNQQQYQQQQQEYQRAQQQRVVAEERKAQFDAKLAALMDNTSPEAVLELQLEFPEKFEVLGKIGTQFSKNERQQKLDESIEIIGMVRFGKTEAVKDLYMERAELLEASGDTEAANNARLQAQQVEEDPDAFLTQMYMMQAAIGGPDKFIENMDQLRETQAAYLESQVEAKRQIAPSIQAMRDAGIIGELEKTTDKDKFRNGLTIFRTKSGEIFGRGVDNVILQGSDLTEAIKQATTFEADAIGEKAASRVRGGLEAEIELQPELSELVARATQRGEISQKLAKESFDTLVKARRNIGNLDAAIAAVDAGANSGVIQSKFPNWKASSIELKNIQRQLGLDVIGAVTFGALSKGELDLALSTALDLDLDTAALTDLLERKKAAQIKMIAELEKATMYFSAGGNLGDYVQIQQSYEVPTGAQEPMGQSSESVQVSVEW
jgi:hypothetical protein